MNSPESILQNNIGTAEIAPIIDKMLSTAEVCYRRAYIGCRYISISFKTQDSDRS